ncbi:group 10 secretory phospholipase A2 isoform X2 [Bubalus bubalis]|uniref:group 10 secretory phospholipase A2 isoform X2 n=1 Tax=Bubalus bubalis TaxID=89462 RepID=UPI00042CDAA2|nr:group 10 secretory phospholipase A2 isoform X2 [Bubalus bubalis]
MAPLPLCPKVGLLLLLLLGSGPGLRAAPQRSHVHRRGLIGLAGTIDCVGPRPALVYVKYGCFCGLGGHGQPQDAIDWCCHAHDCCYTHAENSGCNPKLQPYSWNCVNQSVKCGTVQPWSFSGSSSEVPSPPGHVPRVWPVEILLNQRRTNAKNSYASVTRSLLTA